jgi:hypothetical protein
LPFKTDYRSPKSGHTHAKRNLNERQVSGAENAPRNGGFEVGSYDDAGALIEFAQQVEQQRST